MVSIRKRSGRREWAWVFMVAKKRQAMKKVRRGLLTEWRKETEDDEVGRDGLLGACGWEQGMLKRGRR